MKVSDVSVPETMETFNAIMAQPEKMFEMLRIDLQSAAERAVSKLIETELTLFLGRKKYERKSDRCPASKGKSKNYRNGGYRRNYTVKGIGPLQIKVKRDCLGKFKSKLVKRYDRYDKALARDILAMFLSGMSTRNINMFSEQLLGRKISAGEVSNVNKEVSSAIEKWRTRPLTDVRIKYVFMDGVNFNIRVGRKVVKVPMLIVIGVTNDNKRIFLTIQQGDKEKASTWREIFRDMKHVRGLNKDNIQLGIMDGLPGLEKVFSEEFPNAKTQRCTVHVTSNVLTKIPCSLRKEVGDKLTDIFYAPNKKTAIENYETFTEEYRKTIPSAVDCLGRSIKSCLTFFSFPEHEWISLRTTNAIERVNKEFKRRTKPMEILAGENSAYLLLCFVACKMELGWKCAPFGKKSYLPALAEFTQNA
ncbi:IS256 family transposase [bacterium]|nr:IS256 family transposase [bacterium]MBU3956198.1 IS256 family transposase [bacterium]